MTEFTTIQVRKETKEKLNRLKLSKRETYDDVIDNLIEDTQGLSKEALKDLEEALEDVKNGRLVAHEEVKKMFGL